MPKKSPLVLMILDGWGYNEHRTHNAIAQARTPQWDEWWQTCPHILVDASGHCVGLPQGQMGNSEVGHMHIGAGRLIEQDLTRINKTVQDSGFSNLPEFINCIHELKSTGKTLHIMGLLSPGGVHSHEAHLFAILKACDELDFHDVALHLFLDGRDTPPQSALDSLERLENTLKEYKVGSIRSICGRYYAMDRDKRWERLEPVYRMLTQGMSAHTFDAPHQAIASYYQQGIYDEFIPPTLIGKPQKIMDGDAVLFFNFRADRARQLTAAFVNPQFNGFNTDPKPQLSAFVTMTHYDDALQTTELFPPVPLQNTLGEVLAKHGLKQLRIAETEKYAHVTFFFNGGKEDKFDLEDRVLIPSPKVATYDLKPEMSAPDLTKHLVQAIESGEYDVLICNYANADMVGHSGILPAAIKAIECLDTCMHDVWQALSKMGGKLLITSDHGNAEFMFDDETHQPHTAHTTEPVPLLYVGGNWHFTKAQGMLTDIAPTVLALLGITPPPEMTGSILLEPNHAKPL